MRYRKNHGARYKVFPVMIFLSVLFALGIILIIYSMLTHNVDYHSINDADKLNIYEGGNLIASLDNPSNALGVADAVYITSPKQLGLTVFRMKELYMLEYIANNITIARISILSPSDSSIKSSLINKGKQNEWNILCGEYVVMRKGLCYFSLGNSFYSRLSALINSSDKES